MKTILAIIALVLVIASIAGCGPRAMPTGKEPAAAVAGETEISEDVSEIAALENELGDSEAEAELDSIGDMFSDW